MRKISAAILVLAVVVLTGAASLKGWELLGERTVTDRGDHDVIAVTATEGTFRQIKLSVQRRAVDFHRLVIHFGNGADQQVELKSRIRAGGESRAIDLEGSNRVIKSVEFWYDAVSRGRQAVVRLYGQ